MLSEDISCALVGRKELRALVPYDSSYIAKLERKGQFPRRVPVGPGKVGYVRSEVEAWLRERIAVRDQANIETSGAMSDFAASLQV